ncbi:MAG: Photosystem I assembly protein Ycf3, partial [Alphaproteobacteria bacterium MarineAlpha12_Bin1]
MKQSVDQIISKAKRFLNKGDYLEARALYLSILEDFPDNRRARLGLDEANRSIKPEITKDNLDSLFSAYSQGKFQDVVNQATPFLDIHSQNSDILNLLGSANLMLGDLDLAIKYYREVIRLKPDYAHAYNNLGVAFQNKGNHSEAVIQSKQAIDINPEYAEAYYNLANSLRIQKDYSGAILNFKQALELKDDYVEAYNNLGIVLRVVGELEESVDCLNRAISINPNFRLAHHNLGNTLQDMGDLGLSIESNYNALRIKPDYKDVWTSLGFTIKSLQLSGDADLDLYYERLRTVDVNKTNYNVLQHRLASFQPHLADTSFEDVIDTISANSD